MKRIAPALLFIFIAAACSGRQQQSARTRTQQLASSVPVAAKNAYLATAVMAKLTAIDVDAAASVHVSADRGSITLTGRAHSPAERRSYEHAATSVSGVTSVRNEITVANFAGIRTQAADAALTARVAAAIAAQSGANVFRVKPSSANGTVTLNGSVNSNAVKQSILQAVRAVPGVRRVIDRIAVTR